MTADKWDIKLSRTDVSLIPQQRSYRVTLDPACNELSAEVHAQQEMDERKHLTFHRQL